MGEIETYFFDTYAFYEIIHGNKNYRKYEKGIAIITTKLNLMELHYGLMLLYGKNYADYYYDLFISFVVDFDDNIIKKSNEFRIKNKKLRLSYIDCIGYTIAKNSGVKFLTGDEGFKTFENVEFVK
ncbi:MAG: PIN domain-containing protein [Nanoarchaeota archaeon]